MMYPFMTLNDETEIVHSDMQKNGTVKVYIEKPDEQYGFKHATCWLPNYTWEDVCHFSKEEIEQLEEKIRSTAHLIIEFSQEGGFENEMNESTGFISGQMRVNHLNRFTYISPNKKIPVNTYLRFSRLPHTHSLSRTGRIRRI